MNLKELQIFEYSLLVFTEIYENKKGIKINLQPIIKWNNKLVKLNSFKSNDHYPIEYKKYSDVSIRTYEAEIGHGIYYSIRKVIYENFNNVNLDNLLSNVDILLDILLELQEKINIENTTNFDFLNYIYNLNFLESNTVIPMYKVDNNEVFEVISLVEQTVHQTQ